MKPGTGILLYNPRSANAKARIPNSVLALGAGLQGQFEWMIVDGNLEIDPWQRIEDLLKSKRFMAFGCTVMPGIQIREAIPFSKRIKVNFPEIFIIWGGYFPQAHLDAVMRSGFVDCVVKGPGISTLKKVMHELSGARDLTGIPNLAFSTPGGIKQSAEISPEPDGLFPSLPYEQLHTFYPLDNYLKSGYLGRRILTCHFSFGCPFSCSFCAIPGIYHAGWYACRPEQMAAEILKFKDTWGCDAVEFSDNNFFVSEKRIVEFSHLIKNSGIRWWGEGRADTLMGYSDESLRVMRDSGCVMIFMGAESGDHERLNQMGKGGVQSGSVILELAERLKKFDIIPEFSFVMGLPVDSQKALLYKTKEEIRFIRQLKKINALAEIIIYIYSPVPGEENLLNKEVLDRGLKYPQNLEDWLSPDWIDFDLRREPKTPWMSKKAIRKIRNFETVLNGYYPTVTDLRISKWKRMLLRGVSFLRYKSGLYCFPIEIKVCQKIFQYRQPEKEGF